MTEEVYVRRRHWSLAEKRQIVSEAETSGNVMATAKRYRIQAQQVYRWRERVLREAGAPGFIPLIVGPPGSLIADPAPVPEPAMRLEMTLRAGRLLAVEGRFDLETILALARGLEALR